MADTIYRIVYINKLETRSDNKVYSDLDNVIWSLEKEGFKKVNEIENTFARTEYEENGKKINTLAVIQEVTHYEGRRMPKEHVYLKDPIENNEYEKSLSLKLIRLLAELAYDDLTEQERRDLEIEVGSLALDYKKELEDKGEL